jgi:hypothetical protein
MHLLDMAVLVPAPRRLWRKLLALLPFSPSKPHM